MHRRSILHFLTGVFAGTQAGLAKNAPAVTVDVGMFGAVGDGITDDSPAFRAAQTFVSSRGGGTIRVPHTPKGYRIGTGTHEGPGARETGIVVGSGTRWVGEGGVRLIAGSRTARGNYVFQISDVQDVQVEGFLADGQARHQSDQPYVFISMSGVVKGIRLHNLSLYNFANFALQYADKRTDPILARFQDIVITQVRIGGTTGVTGAGAGINLFPRSQSAEGAPASRGLVIDTIDVDVTNGSNDTRKHGPQGLKINNVDGIGAYDLRCKGGDVAAVIITNGCRNVKIQGRSSASRIGLTVDTYNNAANALTGGVVVQNWIHYRAGVTASKVDGLRLKGALQGVTILSAYLEGADFRIADNYANDRISGNVFPGPWNFGRIEIDDGNLVLENLSDPAQPPLGGLFVESLFLAGKAGTGRVALGGWPLLNARIRSVTLQRVDGHGLVLGGSGNLVDTLEIIDGNLSGDANVWGLVDVGRNNTVQHIRLSGSKGKMSHFANISIAGAGTTIRAFSGISRAEEGLRVANQENGPPLRGDLRVESEEFKLLGPPQVQHVFLADRDYWIASVELLYMQNAEYDSGAILKIGTTEKPSAYVSFQVERGAQAGDTALRQNTVGSGAFKSRKLPRGSTLTFSSNGGKAGAERVRLFANLIPEL